MSMEAIMRQEARLVILRALSDQPGGTLGSGLLVTVLETYGILRPRTWVHAELRALEQAGAVIVREAGSVLIGTLTERGRDHVEHRAYLDDVKRPSLPGA